MERKYILWSEIKKGYEITKDTYVVLEKEDLEGIKLKTNNTIEIKEFIESREFDPIFIEKSYYIGPDLGKKKIPILVRKRLLLKYQAKHTLYLSKY
jgi:DNA end-binding protein Ku